MNKFKNFKLSTRINISFVIIIAVVFIGNIYMILSLREVKSINTEFNNGPHKIVKEAMGIEISLEAIGRNINEGFNYTDQDESRERILVNFEKVNNNITTLEKLLPEEKDSIEELKAAVLEFRNEYERIYLITQEDNFKIHETKIDFNNYIQDYKNSLEKSKNFEKLSESIALTFNKKVDKITIRTISFSALLFLINIIVCVIIARSFKISINKPINQIKNAANKMSRGDFNINIDYESKDELGDLSKSMVEMSTEINKVINDTVEILEEVSNGNFDIEPKVEYIGIFENIKNSINKFTIDLSETISQINLSSEEVGMASSQVAEGSQMLAQGATEQASAIEELSSIIMEVSEKINDSASDAKKANILSLSAGEEVKAGNEKMKEMIRAMDEISSSSNEIGRIIKTIDDIAFQTNILALNAAVEAARAGSAGKGFAVVADEVRNLAAKSADAAKHTADLIENSIKSVENGIYIVDETAASLEKIIDRTNETILLVDNIAKSSEEESIAMNQVTLGVEQISQVIQTNSATSEESAAASQELSAQATNLKLLIDNFKLKTEKSKNLATNIDF